MRRTVFAYLAFAVSVVVGQTTTTVDELGQTVVEVITIDPVLGAPTTLTVATTTLIPTTTTVVNPAGQSVVQVISFNAVNGLTVTQTLSTIAATVPGLTTPTPVLPTTVPIQADTTHLGPQAPPTTTISAGPTTYTYTTTDSAGNTVAAVDVFTPTTIPVRAPSSLTGGSVLAYSDWTALVGTSTVATGNFNAASRANIPAAVCVIVAGLITSVLGGMLVL